MKSRTKITMRATAKKRTIGTMKRGLEVTGAAYGAAVAVKAVLRREDVDNKSNNFLENLRCYCSIKR